MITQAPPDRVFALINDLHNWASWSPYEKLDPAMRKTYRGAASGQGAVYEWEGNNKVGKGRMEIVDASRPSRVTVKLDLVKPMEGHNIAEFTLQSKGDLTTVTWAMHGPSPYVATVISVFFSMDRLLGRELDTGLGNLKTVAEK
jgi:uncharacterized protein YndB with AHSA1/START domain